MTTALVPLRRPFYGDFNLYGGPMAIQGEVITPEERIRELEDELRKMRGGGQGGLAGLISNPGVLKSQFNLDEAKSAKVRAGLTGLGAGLSTYYLGRHIGEPLAAAIGAFAASMVARRLLG